MADIINTTQYPELTGLFTYLLGKHLPGWEGKLIVTHNDQTLAHYSTPAVQLLALLSECGMEGVYALIVAKGLSDPIEIACHEFVHLMQMIGGRLSVNLKAHTFLWDGRSYRATVPYDERPWEQEALQRQNTFYKEFKHHLKDEKH